MKLKQKKNQAKQTNNKKKRVLLNSKKSVLGVGVCIQANESNEEESGGEYSDWKKDGQSHYL